MAYIYFAICAITGPVGGVVAGGVVFNSLGGFENYRSFPIAVAIMTIGSVSALPLPFVTEIMLSAGILWFQFFCGGFCMPLLMSTLLQKVPNSARTTANSLSNCF
jgi:MFS family permease